MSDEDLKQREKEKTARKAEVLKKLEKSKHDLLKALEILDCKMPMAERKLNIKVKSILGDTKVSKFNMSRYLRSSKMICLAFASNIIMNMRRLTTNRRLLRPEADVIELLVEEESVTYILAHARLFGDQTQSMFELVDSDFTGTSTDTLQLPFDNRPLPNSKYMRNIAALISDLNAAYNKKKYKILNANMTYLTLLILRKCVQDSVSFSSLFHDISTNEDYIKFCPDSFTELPQMGKLCTELNMRHLAKPAILAVYAFLTVTDDLSKTILQNTCIQYFKWHNMLLPGLFFKVVDVYGLEVAMLWDLLSSEKTVNSLSRLGLYIARNSSIGELLPFKSALNLNYTSMSLLEELSGDRNVYLCTILAYIIDIKIGYSKSFIRNSDWATDDAAIKAGRKIAREFYKFYGN